MKPNQPFFKQLTLLMLVTVVFSMTFNIYVYKVIASPTSSYSFKFTVDTEGSTNVEVSYISTDSSGDSWVVVPKFSSWSKAVTSGYILQNETVSTTDVGLEDLYFYQVFTFSYKSSSGSFAMTIQYTFPNGALIIESRGMFFSPQIGFKQSSSCRAEVIFNNYFRVNQNNAVAVGTQTHPLTEIDLHHAVLDPLPENLLRLQVEFSTSLSASSTTLKSQNGVFSFDSANKYVDYATNILNLYDRLYGNLTRLFNVTLTPLVDVQFFLPSFEEFLSVGGFTPFTGAGAGTININIFFIRAVNGTIEVIATHELVHHFLIKAGLSPNYFLWFHEGMAQYVSVTLVERLGYEGAKQEKDRLEQSATQLIQQLHGENFDSLTPIPLQSWNPSYSPTNVGNYYVAAYYVVSHLAQEYNGLDYYKHFFELLHGVNVDSIDILTLYLSRAASAPVAITLQGWGFSVIDLYTSPKISEKIVEAQRAIAAVNPVFQPYKYFAEFFYKQGLLSIKRGDNDNGMSFLQTAIILANLAPLLTLFTIAVLLGIIAYLLHRRSRKIRLKPAVPSVPPPPPEIFPPSVA